MRLIACGRRVGVRCDHCGRAAVSDQGLGGVVSTDGWFRHVRLVNRHVCAACLEALPSARRAEYVRASTAEIGEPRRRALTDLPAA
jgi:hypothetical protein